ncbi:MAG: hypothetical protein QOF60_3165 [Actinomycetota bacterium]|jgi:hypothetical protein|nr:hypothetical protein [Actinomycetota bacterium]
MGGAGRRLHPDFGPSDDPNAPYGIPYVEVGADHATTSVRFDYDDESDPGPYPFGPDIPVEGGSPTAGSGAIFDLRANALRPAGWTSADDDNVVVKQRTREHHDQFWEA